MWIVPWDPFLMKKLLKSEICRFMNSAQCVLIGWEEGEKSNFVAIVYVQCMNSKRKPTNACKKKEKRQTQNAGFPPNPYIALAPFWYTNKMLKTKMIYLKGNKPFWNIGQKLRKKRKWLRQKKIIWIISL